MVATAVAAVMHRAVGPQGGGARVADPLVDGLVDDRLRLLEVPLRAQVGRKGTQPPQHVHADDLVAAARDGATRAQTLIRVVLPLAAPGVASVAIFSFIMAWTEYMFASVLILSDANRPVPVGLAGIIGQYQVDWGLLLAGATVTMLPVLILFSLVGRYFVEGLTAGAVK